MAKNESNNKKNKDSNIKYMNKRLIVMLLLLIVVFVSSTFAWFTYSSKKSALVLTIGDYNKSTMTLSPYQITGTLDPSDSYTDGVCSNVKVVNNGTSILEVYLYYKINELPSELIENGLKVTYEYIVNDENGGTVNSHGRTQSFNGATVGSNFKVLTDKVVGGGTREYNVCVWVDNQYDQSSVQGKTLNLELNGNIGVAAAPPVVSYGMIPVTIDNLGNVTTISENSIAWYSYVASEWANMVLVNRNYIDTYSGTTDVTVNKSHIIGYYVWIPRYKYKIWTTGFSSAGSEQSIDIIFENADDPISLGTTVGSYRTNSAFWWDDNENQVVDDGEMLSGIWVGKFETSTSEDGDCYPYGCDASDYSPRILPNVSSISNVSIEDGQDISQEIIWNILSTDIVDSHIMKNSEWGAVAYLSHSDYGINKQIRINNYFNNNVGLTGCGALTDDENESDTCGIEYGAVSSGVYPQSTTGNISGIFDMSGGLEEHVAANFASSGYDKYFNYYNGYPSTVCINGECFGHALNETSGWHNDSYLYDVDDFEEGYYIVRGGRASSWRTAGIFSFGDDGDNSSNVIGFRSVIVPYGISES